MFDSSIKKGKGRRENSCTESHVEDEVVGRHLASARLGLFLILGIWGNAGYPPSPWPIGIFNLRGNCELNLGAQALRGKILSRKELRCDFSLKIATIWNHHSGLARGVKRFRRDIYVVFPERECVFGVKQVSCTGNHPQVADHPVFPNFAPRALPSRQHALLRATSFLTLSI